MKSLLHRSARYGNKDGQALVLFTLFLLVLILFVGLAVDLGFAYLTKAQLSKAVDAATLAGVSNYQQSDNGAAATTNALNTFYANYATNGVTGRGTAKVIPTVTFGLDGNNNRTINVQASATIKTYFLRILSVLGDSQWKTLTVGDSATATRSKVVMTLVLDRSGSMSQTCMGNGCSGGSKYLPNAVSQFISIFDDESDEAAVVTFASSVSNDVVMSTPFKTKVNNAVNYINTHVNSDGSVGLWVGGTCSVGGLTNALNINNSINAPNSIKVVVFFTDGLATMSQGTFNGKSWNFGGQAYVAGQSDPGAGLWVTNTPVIYNDQNDPTAFSNGCNVACGSTPSCAGVSTFLNTVDGQQRGFCAQYITQDASNRCVLVANQMRVASNYVYAVGLDIQQVGAPTLELLQEIANDPGSGKFNPTMPIGAALISNGNDLTQVFQQIASDIILRLIK